MVILPVLANSPPEVGQAYSPVVQKLLEVMPHLLIVVAILLLFMELRSFRMDLLRLLERLSGRGGPGSA